MIRSNKPAKNLGNLNNLANILREFYENLAA